MEHLVSTTTATLTALAVGAVSGLLAWRMTADNDAHRAARRRAARRRLLAELDRHTDPHPPTREDTHR